MGVASGKCEKIRRNRFVRGKQLPKLLVRIFAVPKRGRLPALVRISPTWLTLSRFIRMRHEEGREVFNDLS
jgi:hypothetical protein